MSNLTSSENAWYYFSFVSNKNENLRSKLLLCILTGHLSNATFVCIPDIAFMDYNLICDGVRQCVHTSDENNCGKSIH